jgi:plastocyanin domain-containing protein
MATPTTLPASFTAGQVLTAAQMNDLRGAFRVLQVNSTTLTTPFTSSSTTNTIVTGLSVSITPSATSSKILVIAHINGTNDVGTEGMYMQLQRDSTAIAVGTGGSTNNSTSLYESVGAAFAVSNVAITVLDSPASTSAITYAIYGRNNAAGTFYVNRTKASSTDRFASTITVMEISA